jgi:hypothetical protein
MHVLLDLAVHQVSFELFDPNSVSFVSPDLCVVNDSVRSFH